MSRKAQKGSAVIIIAFLLVGVVTMFITSIVLVNAYVSKRQWHDNALERVNYVKTMAHIYYQSTCNTGLVSEADLNDYFDDVDLDNPYGTEFQIEIGMDGGVGVVEITTEYNKTKFALRMTQKDTLQDVSRSGNEVTFRHSIGVQNDDELAIERQEQRLVSSLSRTCF